MATYQVAERPAFRDDRMSTQSSISPCTPIAITTMAGRNAIKPSLVLKSKSNAEVATSRMPTNVAPPPTRRRSALRTWLHPLDLGFAAINANIPNMNAER